MEEKQAASSLFYRKKLDFETKIIETNVQKENRIFILIIV